MTWVLQKQGTIPEAGEDEWRRIAVGPKGEAHVLIRGKENDPVHRVYAQGREIELGRLGGAYGLFDMFDDGRLCLASFPSKRDDNSEKTAMVLDPDGKVLVRFHVGYGIEDVQVGPDNRIWVSYFDEGVFSGGNLPANGLNAFDDQGRVVWQHDQTIPIDDCYALNVSGEGVWFCAYSDFDLCQVREDGKLSARRNQVAGAGAFALHGNRVMFSAQYKDSLDTVHLASFSGGEVGKPKAMWLVTEDGSEIPPHGVRMRGGFVHVFAGANWFRGHLSELG